jgi:hypothetical protein
MAGLPELGGEDISADATLNSMLAFLTAGFRAPQRGNGSIVAGGITAGEIVKL